MTFGRKDNRNRPGSRRGGRRPGEAAIEGLLAVSGWAAIAIVTLIGGFILIRGSGSISVEFLTAFPSNMGRTGGIFPVILSTLFAVVLAMLFAIPLGVLTAAYLTEDVKQTWPKKAVSMVLTISNAMPSILFGLLGYSLFVRRLKPLTGGWSVLSGSLTVALMVLPQFTRATQEALMSVPPSYREASLALGAGQADTFFRVILGAATPGILAAGVLSMGRVVAESAALLLTMGGGLRIPVSPFVPGRTLAMHLYLVAMEVGAMDKAYGTALVLMVISFALNQIARKAASKAVHLSDGRA